MIRRVQRVDSTKLERWVVTCFNTDRLLIADVIEVLAIV